MMLRRHSPTVSMWDRPLPGPSLFDDVFESFFNLNRSVSAGPRFVSRETEDGYRLIAELPGLSPEDLEITVENGILTVRGERKIDAPEGYHVLRRERVALRFSRSFSLTDLMDGEKIEAKLDDGLLEIRIPRRPEAQPRTITVKSA